MKPNILYIMSDDHAANAISAYGSRLASVFRTPNLDRIADEGARLTGFFSTNSICTPARASILTGQYGHVNGVRTLSDHWNPIYFRYWMHLAHKHHNPAHCRRELARRVWPPSTYDGVALSCAFMSPSLHQPIGLKWQS